MSPTARKNEATKELLRQVATQSTGRLIADVAPEPIEVFLMSGDIVGAVTHHDEAKLLQQAIQLSLLPTKRGAQLQVVIDGGHSIFGPLLDEIPAESVDQLLIDRFRENLVRFVGSNDAPAFEAMPGVFVDNMQMGHDTAELIEWAGVQADRAQLYPVDTEVVCAPDADTADCSPAQLLLLQAATTTRTLEQLVQDIPGEPWLLQAAAVDLITRGLLVESGLQLSPVAIEGDEEDDDAPTQQANNALLAAELEDDEEEPPPADEAPQAAVQEQEDQVADHKAIEDADEPVEQVVPQDLSMWLDSGDGISDEDLAFFEDHEHDRGAGQGGFTTESHNLDKVEVGKADDEDEILEVGEATSTKYGAPVLSDSEAMDKIEVLNDVLRRISTAFDTHVGTGRGPTAIQLLVDGVPAKFTAILHDLEIDEDGEVPPEDVLGNLAGRPLSEQRVLLNSALKDLIERALSTAADELPDESFDEVYGSVAGYNTRLGL